MGGVTTQPSTTLREPVHPPAERIRLGEVLHALADPVRLSAVRRPASGPAEQACSALELPVSKSTSTRHFRVLRESGVIRQVYRGTAKMNALRRAELDALFPGLLDGVPTAADAEDARVAG